MKSYPEGHGQITGKLYSQKQAGVGLRLEFVISGLYRETLNFGVWTRASESRDAVGYGFLGLTFRVSVNSLKLGNM